MPLSQYKVVVKDAWVVVPAPEEAPSQGLRLGLEATVKGDIGPGLLTDPAAYFNTKVRRGQAPGQLTATAQCAPVAV
jgi:hypothetical protein